MSLELYDFQVEAIDKMFNGCILNGGVGSGKTLTSLGYYWKQCGGSVRPWKNPNAFKKLLIITTAKKRDSEEWEMELAKYGIPEKVVIVDSWNNINKYIGVTNAFVIFDEQRVVGKGAWVKSFIKIARDNGNEWILLSATPGDTWMDYIPVFVANKFYKNRTDFITQHVVWARYSHFPKVDKYFDVQRLIRLRDKLLIPMIVQRATIPHHIDILCTYRKGYYDYVNDKRRLSEDSEPIRSAGELCYELRKIVNSDDSRVIELCELIVECHKSIVFYNFDYELDILRTIMDHLGMKYAEWNGHKHQPVPNGDDWCYLVQYTSGCEGWNCITTNTVIFYSQNYSWKVVEQASGRIDRMNTKFVDLWYYHLKSDAPIDIAISKAIENKKQFNEKGFVDKISKTSGYSTKEKRKQELKEKPLPKGFYKWSGDDDIIVSLDGDVMSCKRRGDQWQTVVPFTNQSGVKCVTINGETVSVSRLILESD